MKKKWLGVVLAVTLMTAQTLTAFAADSISAGVVETVRDEVRIVGERQGTAIIDDKALSFAIEDAAIAGLPTTAVGVINSINAGVAPKTAAQNAVLVENTNLDNKFALTSTYAIVTRDSANSQVVTGDVTVTIYVPNLVRGLNNVQVLFYDNATDQWRVIEPIGTDFANKTVTFTISGSGTFSIIYTR